MRMSKGYLRRYTNLPALIYFLTEKKLTLLDPESWNDSNDSYYLKVYRERKKLASVLALCFTDEDETYHHWSVFAPGSAGVCIVFKRAEFIDAVRAMKGLRHGVVRYVLLTELRRQRFAVSDLPFRKRSAYQHESEFRLIYESAAESKTSFDIPVPFECLVQVRLSPWLPKELMPKIRQLLHSIDGCKNLRIDRSGLISNQEWKNAAIRARS
jgi:hypothetical protein